MQKPQNKEQAVIGIGWYRPEQWERLLEVSVDADELERTYAEWEAFASKAFRDRKRPGVSIIKIDVDVEELISWCQEQGLAVNADSRARFILHKTQKRAVI